MRGLLLWFLFFFNAMLVALGVAVAMFSRQLRRQNRVDPDTETFAPMVWLWSPAQAARLHRRLRSAATSVYIPPPTGSARRRRRARADEVSQTTPTEELSRGLREQATGLDEQLVRAARLPRPMRRQHLRNLQPQVIEVERLATRLLQHQRRVTAVAEVPGMRPVQPSAPEALAAIAGQLDVLEEAHEELFAIERANGLLDPDEVMRRVAVQPAYAPRLAPRSTLPPVGPPVSGPPAPTGPPWSAPPYPPSRSPRPPGPPPGSTPAPGPPPTRPTSS